MSTSTFAEALHEQMALTEISVVQHYLEQMEGSTGPLPPLLGWSPYPPAGPSRLSKRRFRSKINSRSKYSALSDNFLLAMVGDRTVLSTHLAIHQEVIL